MNKDPFFFITTGPTDERVPDISAEEAAARQGGVAAANGLSESDKMSDPLGLNLDTYLSGDLPTDTRIQRLEAVVKGLQTELKMLKEQGHVVAMGGMDVSGVEADPLNPALPPADQVIYDAAGQPLDLSTMKKAEVEKGPRPVQAADTTVTGIRVGKHPGYVRIVFDVTGKTPFKADLDNNEKILVVELNGTAWQPPVMSESFGKMSLLKSYKVDPMGGGAGHIFVLQLKGPTSVMKQTMLPALSGGGQRIVIDLKL